jgi:hypothetical protein
MPREHNCDKKKRSCDKKSSETRELQQEGSKKVTFFLP